MKVYIISTIFLATCAGPLQGMIQLHNSQLMLPPQNHPSISERDEAIFKNVQKRYNEELQQEKNHVTLCSLGKTFLYAITAGACLTNSAFLLYQQEPTDQGPSLNERALGASTAWAGFVFCWQGLKEAKELIAHLKEE